MQKNNIAIIPARGGSKRIPRKNIRNFLGKPIICYSISAAIESGCFDEVMVSTDDQEIAEISLKQGAKVPFLRSNANSDDFSTIADVSNEVLENYKSGGRMFEYFCCILPTAPFVTATRIREGFESLSTSSADSLVAITRFNYPIQRALRLEDKNKLRMFWPENYSKRSQDLEASYHDTGQFYWLKTAALDQERKFFTENTLSIIIPELEVQDIDNEEDWLLAEMKYKLSRGMTL